MQGKDQRTASLMLLFLYKSLHCHVSLSLWQQHLSCPPHYFPCKFLLYSVPINYCSAILTIHFLMHTQRTFCFFDGQHDQSVCCIKFPFQSCAYFSLALDLHNALQISTAFVLTGEKLLGTYPNWIDSFQLDEQRQCRRIYSRVCFYDVVKFITTIG